MEINLNDYIKGRETVDNDINNDLWPINFMLLFFSGRFHRWRYMVHGDFLCDEPGKFFFLASTVAVICMRQFIFCCLMAATNSI